jgi:cytochrome c5
MRPLAWLLALACSACGVEASPSAGAAEPIVAPTLPELEPWSDAWLEREAERYLDEPEFRRAQLEASLTNPNNQYSRKRLALYALGDRGWDALPEWVPATAPITNADLEQLRAGVLPQPAARIWDGRRPTTLAEWIALGERVFYEYPLRPEIFAEHALRDLDLARAVGLHPEGLQEQSRWPGVIAFVDLDGELEVGITCAICHVAPDSNGVMIPGRARRDFDYGRMRLAYYQDTGSPLDPRLAARMAGWGPGRADITDDEDEDPVAIPDLWNVRELRHLTQAATLTHEHPAALAIRQETQLLHANREQARPPRELAWALAMYVYSLAPPPREPVAAAPAGAALFRQTCARCHSGPTGAGDPIAAERVGTDRALAFGRARGTGLYRPAPLVRVAEAGPYLHDGSVPTLEQLLDEDRLAHTPGHAFGTERSADERAALLNYLLTL